MLNYEVGAGYLLKIYLTGLWLFLFFAVQSVAIELSGKAETNPGSGFIVLQGRELLLHGVQIIPQNAKCKDNNGQWSCGESAWEALKTKLDSGPVHCTLVSDRQNNERYPEQASCLLKKENLSIWLIIRGWAITSLDTENFLSNQENLARQNHAGIWRDGFMLPDLWRTGFKIGTKNCNVCSVRRKSFMRNAQKQKSP